MNLCFHFSFLSSFYTCEDAVVQEEDVTVRPWVGATVAAVAGVTAVHALVSSGHIYLYCNNPEIFSLETKLLNFLNENRM
jgi:hypothetical protein